MSDSGNKSGLGKILSRFRRRSDYYEINPHIGQIAPDELDTAGALMHTLTQSVLRLLYLNRHFLIEMPSLQPDKFRSEIESIMAFYQNPITPEQAEDLSSGSVSIITNQKESELEYLQAREDELRIIIDFIVEEVHKSLRESDSFGNQMAGTLKGLSRSLEISDLQTLKDTLKLSIEILANQINDKLERDQSYIKVLQEQVEILRSQMETLKTETHTDALTKLYNRRAFDERIISEVNMARRLRRPLSLVMIDMDYFKEINDTYGHQAGDELLCAFSSMLSRQFFRKIDFIARYGGDEFIIIMSHCDLKGAQNAAGRLLKDVKDNPLRIGKDELKTGVSIGVAQYILDEKPEDFVKRTDEALYDAKNSGRGIVAISLANIK